MLKSQNDMINKFNNYNYSSNKSNNLTIIDINSKSIDSLKNLSLQSQMIPEDSEGFIISNLDKNLNSNMDNSHCLCLVPQLLGNLFNNIIDKILNQFKKDK